MYYVPAKHQEVGDFRSVSTAIVLIVLMFRSSPRYKNQAQQQCGGCGHRGYRGNHVEDRWEDKETTVKGPYGPPVLRV